MVSIIKGVLYFGMLCKNTGGIILSTKYYILIYLKKMLVILKKI